MSLMQSILSFFETHRRALTWSPKCLPRKAHTNINQGEKTRADQVLLGFAGVYLHFRDHSDPRIAAGIKKRIEKRRAAMDQDFFVITMVLNPFEKISRLGSQAGTSVFGLRTILMRVMSLFPSRLVPPLMLNRIALLSN
jgi:hypothetical protein